MFWVKGSHGKRIEKKGCADKRTYIFPERFRSPQVRQDARLEDVRGSSCQNPHPRHYHQDGTHLHLSTQRGLTHPTTPLSPKRVSRRAGGSPISRKLNEPTMTLQFSCTPNIASPTF
ncbi:hypothetical protein Q8A67_021259 [Cirrhinus molitorella]|uniref:Uncharacterized protein n=1 Tax=Cirrhinus molitorella TaxID=172907 RepID=A0AA88TE77_9TELE|nr:hypothetical protein Q8A67_021259 [Cirrhinus molitorella]